VFHRRKGLPDDWDLVISESWAAWSGFSVDERSGLADIADWLLRHKHWEAAHGFELTDEIATTVALEASLLVLELGTDFYDGVSAIVVHPTTILSRGTYAGPVPGTIVAGPAPLLGEAHDRRGPILIAWDEARRAARHPGSGRNVVFHEFAHKIDMLDGMTDGTPPLKRDAVPRWVEVCTPVYESLRDGVPRPPLDMYGGTNPAEFFAVATEVFFDVPAELHEHERELYEVLRDFYEQDPAVPFRPPLGQIGEPERT
jgi:hypothetical protein